MSGDDAHLKSPTATRRALADALRRLRLNAGMTGEQAAKAVKFSESKITKIERVQAVPSTKDVLQLINGYGGVPDEERQRLLEMARQGNRKEWWERDDLRLPAKLASYLGLEQTATTLRAYDPTLVHGLLQTRDYARAVIRSGFPDLLEHELESLIETRMRRQEALTRKAQPLELWSVMDEAVLRRQVGGREVMHAQLERLAEAADLPNVTLLVMPDSLGAHAALAGPLAILQFEAGARPTLYIEGHAGNLYLERDADLRRGQQVINHVLANAPRPEQSLELIRTISEEMKP